MVMISLMLPSPNVGNEALTNQGSICSNENPLQPPQNCSIPGAGTYKAPLPCGAFFLMAVTRSADQEIFHDELAIHRRKRMFADPAMDQSVRQIGVSFHAHDLVARPAARADKLSRMVLSH